MGTLYDNNMNYLRKAYPKAYDKLHNYDLDSNSQIQAELVQTKNGLLNIKVQTTANNLYVHSNYNPERESDMLFSNYDFANKDTLIIFGFGMGYHLEKLIKDYPKLNKIVIEPSIEILDIVVKNKDITAILKANNVELVVAEDALQLGDYLKHLYMLGKIYTVEFIELPSYSKLFAELIYGTKVKFAEFLRTFNVNLRTELVFLKDWLKNFFLNLRHIPNSADLNELQGKFENVPAIMVSAGPSLKKNLELIRDLADKALIVANGSTISILQAEGIKPHMMLGIDGSEKMSEIFCQVGWTDIIFAYILNLHHKSLEEYQGPKIYLKSNSEPMVQRMEESVNHLTRPVAAGGSCANVTLDFVNKLGCNPIIMIGQDLAYTDMQVYSDGHINKEKLAGLTAKVENLTKAKDIYGNDIYTASYLLTMAYTFERYLRDNANGKLYINATEGGLPLKGSINMKLQEVIDKYCQKDLKITEKLKLLLNESIDNNKDLESKVKDFVLTIQSEAEVIAELSQKRMELINKILSDIKKGKINELAPKNKKINNITKELEQTLLYKNVLQQNLYSILLNIKNYHEGLANQTRSPKEKMGILNQGLKNQFEVVESVNSFVLDGIKSLLSKESQEV